jgi:hypothetical protein
VVSLDYDDLDEKEDWRMSAQNVCSNTGAASDDVAPVVLRIRAVNQLRRHPAPQCVRD